MPDALYAASREALSPSTSRSAITIDMRDFLPPLIFARKVSPSFSWGRDSETGAE